MILQANYTRTRSYQGLKGFLPLLKNLIFHRFAVIKKTPDSSSVGKASMFDWGDPGSKPVVAGGS